MSAFCGPFALLLVLALSGCAGYRVGDISGRDLQGVRSVYVPAANASLEPDLQMVVTNAIIRRFNDDGTLTVNQNSSADSELDLTITNVHTPDPQQHVGPAYHRRVSVPIEATATYVNRKLGRKIFENVPVTGSTNFFTQADIKEGERQALPLAARTSPTTPSSSSPKVGSPRFRPDAHSGRVARPPGNQPTFPSRRSA